MTVLAALGRLASVFAWLILRPSLLILTFVVANPVAADPEVCPSDPGSFFEFSCTFVDGDSTVTVLAGPEGDLLVDEWSVGGVKQLFEQDFWIFDRGRGLPIAAETVSATVDQTTGEIRIDQNILDPTSLMDIGDVSVVFTLTNISAGSMLVEHGEILANEAFQGRIYLYNDFDLNDSSDDDTISVTDEKKITQTGGTTTAVVEVVSDTPDAFEVGVCCDLFNNLDDSTLIDLSNQDSAEGPDDFESAFSWDHDFNDDNNILVFDIHNTISVPEPSSTLLAAVALASVAGLVVGRDRLRRVRSSQAKRGEA